MDTLPPLPSFEVLKEILSGSKDPTPLFQYVDILPRKWHKPTRRWLQKRIKESKHFQKLLHEAKISESEFSIHMCDQVSCIIQTMHLIEAMVEFHASATDEFMDELSKQIRGIHNERYVRDNGDTIRCGIRQTGACGHTVAAIFLGQSDPDNQPWRPPRWFYRKSLESGGPFKFNTRHRQRALKMREEQDRRTGCGGSWSEGNKDDKNAREAWYQWCNDVSMGIR